MAATSSPPPPASAPTSPTAGSPTAVILVRPQEQGNVGAVARAMANMGLSELILVDPAVPLGKIARAFAVKAHFVLDNARRVPSLEEAIGPFSRVVGTTSSRHRDLTAPIFDPRGLATEFAARPPEPTALVFGPESTGLNNAELALCGQIVVIPCSPVQPTLNLAQAVLLVAYELFLARSGGPEQDGGPDGAEGAGSQRKAPGRAPATAGEIEGLFKQLEPLLREVGFARDQTFPGVLQDLRAMAARTGLARREVAILRGICRRTSRSLEKARPR